MAPTTIILTWATACLTIYSAFLWTCWWKWPRLPAASRADASQAWPAVTVVVVARNEAAGIADLICDLALQNYPRTCFELLLMDDASRDGTAEVASRVAREHAVQLTVAQVSIPSGFRGGHKKLALMQAAEKTTAELLLLTDADCRLGPEWISSHVSYYCNFPEAKLVFGPFSYSGGNSFWRGLLNLEALHLTAAAAISDSLNMPTMCSGANLSYRRELLKELEPFHDNAALPSGDDEFMLQAAHKAYPDGTFYSSDREALVTTLSPASASAFFYQRRRWAGKWKFHRKPWPAMLALLVLAGNLGQIAIVLVLLLTGTLWPMWLLAVKWVPELALSLRLCAWFRLRKLLLLYLPMEIIYPFYAVFFAAASNFGKYRWKGRIYP